MYAAFNDSGNAELAWKVLGGCDKNEYCNFKIKECSSGTVSFKM